MKIIIAGDFCPQERVADLIEAEKYSTIFSEIRSITDQADYSILNLEAPIVSSFANPIEKLGPNLKCSPKAIAALKFAGFNAVTLANNHIYDFGDIGISDTISSLEDYGIDYVGAGKNITEAAKILYFRKGDETLAIINCCEHEFSIATKNTGGANPLNPVKQYYMINEARKNADYVLVVVHGGHEHFQLPSLRMVENYRFFIDAGADAVVNHHQHCFSGFETYRGKPIYYGLGNFCFDRSGKRSNKWNKGMLAEIIFNKDVVNHCAYPYIQSDKEPNIKFLPSSEFQVELDSINSIIGDEKLLRLALEKYYQESIDSLKLIFSPFQNRYIIAAQRRMLLPLFLSKKWLIKLQNFILCESHFDKVDYFLRNYEK